MRNSGSPPFALYPLDPRLVPAKPKHSVTDEKVIALEEKKQLVITRKRDGYRHLIAITHEVRVLIYTRGIEDTTDRYPHIVKEISRANLPTNTLLDTEMIVDEDGKDSFEALTRIAKSGPAAAIALQQAVRRTSCMVFDIIVWGSEVLSSRPYADRRDMILSRIKPPMHYVIPVPVLAISFTAATELVRKEGWEGLVLYDAAKPTEFRLDGNSANPPRPDGCWKWKPLKEDDFFIEKWAYGTGRNKNRMGKLFLMQFDSKSGKKVSCGEVGIGFNDEMREFFAKEARYPLAVQVKFERRFKSGALRHPRFMRIRDDKKPEECVFFTELPQNSERDE